MNIIINGTEYSVEKGMTILEACRKAGIHIPTLCHDERLKPYGGCRLCLVDIEGGKKPVTSCTTLVRDNMVIETDSDNVRGHRKEILDLLFSNHPAECLECEKSGDCKLQDYCYEYGVIQGTYEGDKKEPRIDSSNPFYTYDARKCINCGICVRVCDELQGSHAIGFEDRGFNMMVSTPFNEGLINSKCVSCGNCVSYCPVGALQPKSLEKFRHWEAEKTRTTCSYCGVGCQLDLISKDGKVLGAQPAKGEPNDGLLCVKGKFAYKFVNHKDRLKTPLIKRDGKFEEASWDEAYRYIRRKVNEIKEESGPDAFAGLSSARCTNEENYLFQKFFRAVIGTNNIDHCARL